MINSQVLKQIDIEIPAPKRKGFYPSFPAKLPAEHIVKVIKNIGAVTVINEQETEDNRFYKELELRIMFDSVGD